MTDNHRKIILRVRFRPNFWLLEWCILLEKDVILFQVHLRVSLDYLLRQGGSGYFPVNGLELRIGAYLVQKLGFLESLLSQLCPLPSMDRKMNRRSRGLFLPQTLKTYIC